MFASSTVMHQCIRTMQTTPTDEYSRGSGGPLWPLWRMATTPTLHHLNPSTEYSNAPDIYNTSWYVALAPLAITQRSLGELHRHWCIIGNMMWWISMHAICKAMHFSMARDMKRYRLSHRRMHVCTWLMLSPGFLHFPACSRVIIPDFVSHEQGIEPGHMLRLGPLRVLVEYNAPLLRLLEE